jgi:hypothetical protein
VQGAGSGIYSHAVLHATVGCEFLLKLLNLFTQNERRLAPHAVEHRQDLFTQAGILGFQIEVGNNHPDPQSRVAATQAQATETRESATHKARAIDFIPTGVDCHNRIAERRGVRQAEAATDAFRPVDVFIPMAPSSIARDGVSRSSRTAEEEGFALKQEVRAALRGLFLYDGIRLLSPVGLAVIQIGEVWAHSPHTLADPKFRVSL